VGQFQRESKFSTWISRIVVNQCLMRLRKLRGTTLVYLDETGRDERRWQHEIMDRNASPEVDLRNKEIFGVLHREIRRLPPLLRHVLVLRDVDELSTSEVANRLGMSASAVKSRLLRARIELRHRLEKRMQTT
jgi:RNA polymerase sigma-70 factor (ECF subfamily)